MTRSRVSDLVVNALLFAVALVWLFPYAWMVLTSLKTLPEIVTRIGREVDAEKRPAELGRLSN